MDPSLFKLLPNTKLVFWVNAYSRKRNQSFSNRLCRFPDFETPKNKCLIFVFQIFNRDEPDREKLVHVTVKASDNGRPQLEDVCTLAVKINDENDNSPVFDRANYGVPIAQVS